LKKYFSSYWIRSAFYTILQRFSITLFGFINFILIVRQFESDKHQIGLWLLFLVAVGMFELIKYNLLKNAQIKFVSATQDVNEKSVIASSSLMINISLSILFILLILLLSGPLDYWVFRYQNLMSLLVWFIPGICCMVIFSHLEAVQQSHLDFKGVFAGHFVRQFSFFAILVFHKVAGISFTIHDLVIYQSVSLFLGSIVLYVFTKKYLNRIFRPTMAWVKKIIGYGGYIFGSGAVAAVYQNLDQLMISWFGPVAVAPYGVAYRINGMVDVPSFAAADILFPKASVASVEEGPQKIKYLYERMVAILLSFTIPMALFIILFPKLVIYIVAGPGYYEAVPILQLYMIAGILRPAQNQAANLLNSIGKPKLCFYINVGYLVVNLSLNFLFLNYVDRFYGAAIGTVVAFMLGAVFWYFVMKKQIGLELGNIVEHGKEVYKMGYGIAMNAIGRKQAREKVV
jgi:lipopolysaccharide exporter